MESRACSGVQGVRGGQQIPAITWIVLHIPEIKTLLAYKCASKMIVYFQGSSDRQIHGDHESSKHWELLEKVRESQLFFAVAFSCRISFLSGLINTRKESIYISVSILHILTNISSESRPQCYGKVAPSSDVPPVCLFLDPGWRAGLPARRGKSRALTTCDGDSFRKAHLLLLLHLRLTMTC